MGVKLWACELGNVGMRGVDTVWNRSAKFLCEKLSLSNARFSLGVNNKTPIDAIRGELGLYPLAITAIERMAKYYQRLNREPSDSLLSDAFAANKTLHNSWTQSLVRVCDTFNSPLDSRILKLKMQKAFVDKWSASLGRKSHNKLRTYCQIKQDFCFENYLESVVNKEDRIAFTQLRTGSHYLRIETGRWKKSNLKRDDANNNDPEKRQCKMCEAKAIEDEKHFMVYCDRYKQLRQSLVRELIKMYPSVQQLERTPEMLFNYLVACEDDASKLVANYCREAFDTRKFVGEFLPKSPKQVVTRAGRTVKPKVIISM